MRIVLTKKKVWDVVKEYAVISFGILLGISSMNAEDEARDIDRLELREEVGA